VTRNEFLDSISFKEEHDPVRDAVKITARFGLAAEAYVVRSHYARPGRVEEVVKNTLAHDLRKELFADLHRSLCALYHDVGRLPHSEEVMADFSKILEEVRP
jgi:hypothetical protein